MEIIQVELMGFNGNCIIHVVQRCSLFFFSRALKGYTSTSMALPRQVSDAWEFPAQQQGKQEVVPEAAELHDAQSWPSRGSRNYAIRPFQSHHIMIHVVFAWFPENVEPQI